MCVVALRLLHGARSQLQRTSTKRRSLYCHGAAHRCPSGLGFPGHFRVGKPRSLSLPACPPRGAHDHRPLRLVKRSRTDDERHRHRQARAGRGGRGGGALPSAARRAHSRNRARARSRECERRPGGLPSGSGTTSSDCLALVEASIAATKLMNKKSAGTHNRPGTALNGPGRCPPPCPCGSVGAGAGDRERKQLACCNS